MINTISCGWFQAVVPVRVPFVAGEGAGFGQRLHRGVRDGEPDGIGAGVEFGVDAESAAGGGRSDGLHDDFVAGQWPAAPVHRDVGEQAVLDLMKAPG